MSEIVPVRLGENLLVHVEVARPGRQAATVQPPDQVSSEDVGAQEAAARLQQAVTYQMAAVGDTIRAMGDWVTGTVQSGWSHRPDTFEVEFGLTLSIETGALTGVIAKAGGEAALTVRMSWERDRGAAPTAGDEAAGV